MNIPAVMFLVLGVWSFTARPGTLLVLLLASMPFASLAVLPTEITAGMNILPQSMFAVVLILKVLAPHILSFSPQLLNAVRLRNLGYLCLFLLAGIAATAIMPRLFAGEVVIVPMRENRAADLLGPIQANFTQAAYVSLSVLTALTVALMAEQKEFTRSLLLGVLVGGVVCVATGFIDLAAATTGMEIMLAPFRNAEYSFLTNSDVGGVRRVVGFAPEASAFGIICVQLAAALALLRHLYPSGRRRWVATITLLCLLVLALLSTSSTAYAGLAVLGLVYAGNGLRRAASSSSMGHSGLLVELSVCFALVIALLFVLLVRADLFDPMLNLVDEIIFKKSLTSSFYERSYWNSTAWNALASTWGLGIGFGATRTSNWVAAVVSNAGLIGAALLGIFFVQILCKRPAQRTPFLSELLPALKLSLFPALAMESVAAPGPDFGPWVAVVLGSITGIAALTAFVRSADSPPPGPARRFGPVIKTRSLRGVVSWDARRNAPYSKYVPRR